MALSLEAYIMAPSVQRELRSSSAVGHLAAVAALGALAVGLLSRQSVFLTSAFLCTLAFISLLCPMWLVRIHKFKAQINGPWDEAAPKLTSTLSGSWTPRKDH